MSRHQLWLFPHPRPLVDRLGEEFFRALPASPGVYLMCGPREGVLYVGKAKNLRKRLGSYRVANPQRFPRRILRLLHQVTRIEWDPCVDDRIARYREELLITVLQPKFNAAGKVWPARDCGLRIADCGLPRSAGVPACEFRSIPASPASQLSSTLPRPACGRNAARTRRKDASATAQSAIFSVARSVSSF